MEVSCAIGRIFRSATPRSTFQAPGREQLACVVAWMPTCRGRHGFEMRRLPQRAAGVGRIGDRRYFGNGTPPPPPSCFCEKVSSKRNTRSRMATTAQNCATAGNYARVPEWTHTFFTALRLGWDLRCAPCAAGMGMSDDGVRYEPCLVFVVMVVSTARRCTREGRGPPHQHAPQAGRRCSSAPREGPRARARRPRGAPPKVSGRVAERPCGHDAALSVGQRVGGLDRDRFPMYRCILAAWTSTCDALLPRDLCPLRGRPLASYGPAAQPRGRRLRPLL